MRFGSPLLRAVNGAYDNSKLLFLWIFLNFLKLLSYNRCGGWVIAKTHRTIAMR